jgi:hypothetical protein
MRDLLFDDGVGASGRVFVTFTALTARTAKKRLS